MRDPHDGIFETFLYDPRVDDVRGLLSLFQDGRHDALLLTPDVVFPVDDVLLPQIPGNVCGVGGEHAGDELGERLYGIHRVSNFRE